MFHFHLLRVIGVSACLPPYIDRVPTLYYIRVYFLSMGQESAATFFFYDLARCHSRNVQVYLWVLLHGSVPQSFSVISARITLGNTLKTSESNLTWLLRLKISLSCFDDHAIGQDNILISWRRARPDLFERIPSTELSGRDFYALHSYLMWPSRVIVLDPHSRVNLSLCYAHAVLSECDHWGLQIYLQGHLASENLNYMTKPRSLF